MYYGSDGGVVSKKKLSEDGFHESFSKDEWSWGAARSSVNCNDINSEGNIVEWGQANMDSYDIAACGYIYADGATTWMPEAVTYM